eukprot:Anaeramoba_ignava/a219093_24.p2 GENE.a219093_24~~a219093_24.p2  ORF type:complete len:178 (+),score=18.56 a219093_24:1043-1576(+)
MKRVNVLSLIILSIALLFSCQPKVSEKEKLIQKIEEKEKVITETLSERALTREEIKEVINLYDSYYKKFPKDSLSADYLMKAGQAALSVKMNNEAMHFFHTVEKKYAHTQHLPMSVFFQAFIYDESNDTLSAKTYYNKFIKQFPEHKLVNDAKISLKNLGKSIEDIVKEFENKQKDQ